MGLGKLLKGKSEAKKGQKLRPVINRTPRSAPAYNVDADNLEIAGPIAEQAGGYESLAEAMPADIEIPVPPEASALEKSHDAAQPEDTATAEPAGDAPPARVVTESAVAESPETVADEPDEEAAEAFNALEHADAGLSHDVSEKAGAENIDVAAENISTSKQAPAGEVVGEANQAAPEQAVRKKITNMIYNTVCKGSQTQRGVHVETALSSLGALAGFGCQMAVRESMVKPGLMDEAEAFDVIKSGDDEIYYNGDTLNQPLMEAPVSVLGLINEGVRQAGYHEYPDAAAIAAHVAGTLGNAAFGILTIPDKHKPLISPEASLKRFWPLLFEHIRPYYLDKTVVMVEPAMLGWLFAEAAQRLIVEAKNIVEPPLAGRMAFEAAVAMSKIDYRKIMPDYA